MSLIAQMEEILSKIGLSSQESRTYLALLQIVESQTGALCKETNIASSNIYGVLDSLIKKGLVNYRIQNNIKIFMASSPDVLNDLFLDKQKELDDERKKVNEVISKLKKNRSIKEETSNYKYYEGLSGIKGMWHEINSLMDKNMLLKIHTARKESYNNLVGFYAEHHRLRRKKKVNELMIFPEDDRSLAKKRIDKYTKIRFSNLKNEAEWGIIGDALFMQYISKKAPKGFLIHDKVFAKTFELAFDKLWKTSKS